MSLHCLTDRIIFISKQHSHARSEENEIPFKLVTLYFCGMLVGAMLVCFAHSLCCENRIF